CSLLHTRSSSFHTHPSPTGTYTLSLHDALPIYLQFGIGDQGFQPLQQNLTELRAAFRQFATFNFRNLRQRHRATNGMTQIRAGRSEEHTSELQSRENLVCRLLLEKKKTMHNRGT